MIPVQPPQAAQPMPQQPQGQPQQSGPVTIDAVMALLRDGAMRRFRIDIEVDSTITGDESQERQDRSAFIQTTTQFIKEWGPIVAANPMMADLAGELLLFGTRAFRVGRSLEEVIEETVDKLEQQAAQPKPPPQPSPDELVKLEGTKAKVAGEIGREQIVGQTAQQEGAAKQDATKLDLIGKVMDHHQTVAEHHLNAREMDREDQRAEREHERKIEIMDHKAAEAMKPKSDK